jgi:hypothetical protein
MDPNLVQIYSPDPFASGGTADAYKRRLLAAQLLQKKASEDDKVYSNSHGGMKLATALLGGMMEGWEEKKTADANNAGRDALIRSLGIGSGGMGGVSAPSSPSGGSPAGAPSIAGKGVARTMTMPSEFDPLFAETEQKYNLPPGTLKQIAKVESSLNPNAKNPNSSASGLFQFINSTARQYGLADPFDPVASTDAAGRLAADNAKGLRGVLGRDPTPGELYLAHQQGLGGASKILSNPNASVASLVGNEAARLNRGAGMTAGDFAKQWTSKFDGPQQVASADPGYMPGPLSEADAGLAPQAETVADAQARTGVDWNNPVARQHMIDAGLTPPDAPSQTASAAPVVEQPPAPEWQTAQATPEEFDAQLGAARGDTASTAPVAPPPPPRPLDLEALQPQQETAPPPPAPPAPRVPPQAMAQALMAGGAPQIDPNSNNAGAMQFAAAGMGRGGQGMPQAPQQPPPQLAAPRAPSAPAGMYGAPGQAPAAPAQVAASAPTQYAQAGATAQASGQPGQAPSRDPVAAMPPNVAAEVRNLYIQSLNPRMDPYTRQQLAARAKSLIDQYTPKREWKVIGKNDGVEVYGWVDERGKTIEPYSLPGSEPRPPRMLVTLEERRAVGIPDDDKRPYGIDKGKIYSPAGSAPSASVNMPKAETEEERVVGKAIGERRTAVEGAFSTASEKINRYELMKRLTENVKTGRLAGFQGTVADWGLSIGVSPKTLESLGIDPKLPATEQSLTSAVNRAVIDNLGPGGFPTQNFSNTDRDFMTKIFPSVMNRPEANSVIIEVLRRTEQRKLEAADDWDRAQDRKQSFKDWERDWSRKVRAMPNLFDDVADQIKGIGGAPSGDGTLPIMNSPADANKLPPGTRYRRPDGKEYIR